MCNEETYPVEIKDDEVIHRAAFRPYNANKSGKIKLNLFSPPKNLNELSCMRSSIMSIGDCFKKAKEIAGVQKEFHGFALITNHCAKNSFPEGDKTIEIYIKDSRHHFLGHADLIIGIKSLTESEPLPPSDKEKLDNIKSNLHRHTLFVTQNGIVDNQEIHCDKNELLSNFVVDNKVLDIIST